MKAARTVLRGPERSNALGLPDRKRSVIVRTDTDGGLLESVQIINTADGLERVIALGSNLRHRVVRTER